MGRPGVISDVGNRDSSSPPCRRSGILSGLSNHSELSGDDRARLVQAVEAGRAAREEMRSAKSLTVRRKRELRSVIREGDQAAQTLARRGWGVDPSD
jgi:hypothetical protein